MILRDIRAGTLLKMQLDNEKWVQGELIRSTDSEILLSPDLFEEATVRFEKIDSLWIAHGNRMNRGIFWGVLIGGVVGTFTAYVTGLATANSVENWYAYTVLGGMVGIGLGAGAGALVGVTTPDWMRLYPCNLMMPQPAVFPSRE
jgi:hypothetical protein